MVKEKELDESGFVTIDEEDVTCKDESDFSGENSTEEVKESNNKI